MWGEGGGGEGGRLTIARACGAAGLWVLMPPPAGTPARVPGRLVLFRALATARRRCNVLLGGGGAAAAAAEEEEEEEEEEAAAPPPVRDILLAVERRAPLPPRSRRPALATATSYEPEPEPPPFGFGGRKQAIGGGSRDGHHAAGGAFPEGAGGEEKQSPGAAAAAGTSCSSSASDSGGSTLSCVPAPQPSAYWFCMTARGCGGVTCLP
jgi:hypothetical protein